MAGFRFRLETMDGAAADPPILETAVPNWRAGERSTSAPRRCALSRSRTTMQTNRPCLSLRTRPRPTTAGVWSARDEGLVERRTGRLRRRCEARTRCRDVRERDRETCPRRRPDRVPAHVPAGRRHGDAPLRLASVTARRHLHRRVPPGALRRDSAGRRCGRVRRVLGDTRPRAALLGTKRRCAQRLRRSSDLEVGSDSLLAPHGELRADGVEQSQRVVQ